MARRLSSMRLIIHYSFYKSTLMDTSHSRGREVGHHTSRPRKTHLHALGAAKSGSHCSPDGYSTGERRHVLIRHSGRGALEIWCSVKLGKKRAQSRKEPLAGIGRQRTACTGPFKQCSLMFRMLFVTLASETKIPLVSPIYTNII